MEMSATLETAEVEVVRSTGKTETAILSWVFEKFAGAVVGKAAGFGMDYVLALVGITDPSEVKTRLEEIQSGINQILSEIAQIRSQLDDLLKQLQLSTAEILAAIKEETISQARSVIEGHFGTARLLGGDSVQVVSLGDAVYNRLKTPPQEVDTKTFAANVIGAWDIHAQIVKIAQTAATGTPSTKPLLKAWTDTLLAKNKGSIAMNALTIYRTLESYFQQLLAVQFKGISLVTSAKCYDKKESEARSITEAYFSDLQPFITTQTELFVKCADEIIVAIAADSKWLYSPGPTKAADEIRTIARRANVIRAIVNAAVGKGSAATGGICGTLIGRNIELEDAPSRTFTPAGYSASAGEATDRLDAAGAAPIEWEASTDNRYGTLREKSKSGFQAFHYYWPWPAALPEAGKAIDNSFDGGLTPRYYSLDTLQPVDKGGEGTILIADFCEMRIFRGAVFADPAAADRALVSTPPGPATTNNNENRVGFRNGETHGIHAMRADGTGTFQRVLVKGSLEGHMNYHFPQGDPVGFTLELPLFRYKGRSGTLHFAAELEMKLELVEDVIRDNPNPDFAWMLMSPRGAFWLTRTRAGVPATIGLYDTDDRGLSLWGQGSYVTLKNDQTFTADVVLEDTGDAEDLYSLVLRLDVINKLGGGFDPVDGRHAKGRITYGLQGFRMMWK
jgi:hypothetical protein